MKANKTIWAIEVNNSLAGKHVTSIEKDGTAVITCLVTDEQMKEIQWHALHIHDQHPDLAPHQVYARALQIVIKKSKENGTNQGRNEA